MKKQLVLLFVVLMLVISACGTAPENPVPDNSADISTSEKEAEKPAEEPPAQTEDEAEVPDDNVPTESPKATIVIDAGHQKTGNSEKEPIGPGASEMKAKVSSGTTGVSTGKNEYELTLEVAMQLKEKLEKQNYNVIMIRETNDVNISNSERAEIANASAADAFIRIHANGSDNKSMNGAMTICQTGGNPYNGALHDQSRLLSDCVLDEYVAATGIARERVWETDTMSGINWATVPCTILELGYMSNPEEDLKMADPAFQTIIVEGIAAGIDRYILTR